MIHMLAATTVVTAAPVHKQRYRHPARHYPTVRHVQHWGTRWQDEGGGLSEDMRPYHTLDAQGNPLPPVVYETISDDGTKGLAWLNQ